MQTLRKMLALVIMAALYLSSGQKTLFAAQKIENTSSVQNSNEENLKKAMQEVLNGLSPEEAKIVQGLTQAPKETPNLVTQTNPEKQNTPNLQINMQDNTYQETQSAIPSPTPEENTLKQQNVDPTINNDDVEKRLQEMFIGIQKAQAMQNMLAGLSKEEREEKMANLNSEERENLETMQAIQSMLENTQNQSSPDTIPGLKAEDLNAAMPKNMMLYMGLNMAKNIPMHIKASILNYFKDLQKIVTNQKLLIPRLLFVMAVATCLGAFKAVNPITHSIVDVKKWILTMIGLLGNNNGLTMGSFFGIKSLYGIATAPLFNLLRIPNTLNISFAKICLGLIVTAATSLGIVFSDISKAQFVFTLIIITALCFQGALDLLIKSLGFTLRFIKFIGFEVMNTIGTSLILNSVINRIDSIIGFNGTTLDFYEQFFKNPALLLNVCKATPSFLKQIYSYVKDKSQKTWQAWRHQ